MVALTRKLSPQLQRADPPASPRFVYAQVDGRVVRTWHGYLLWFSRSESELVERLIAAGGARGEEVAAPATTPQASPASPPSVGAAAATTTEHNPERFALPLAHWLDPADANYQQRLADLPGLLARGVVRTSTRDGETWVALNIPAPTANSTPCEPTPPAMPTADEHPNPGDTQGEAPKTQLEDGSPRIPLETALTQACPDCLTAAERVAQADVIGAVLRARGGQWLLRSDAVIPPCTHAPARARVTAGTAPTGAAPPATGPGARTTAERPDGSSPRNAPNDSTRHSPPTAAVIHTYSTSWRGGSAEATRSALLDLVDVDRGIIAGIRRGSGLPEEIPVWFAGPNRALSTADPSGLTWRWPGNAMGKGLTDAEAQLSALAEAAERWSGTWQRGDGTDAVRGRDLANGEEVLVPSDVVYMGHPPVAGHARHTDSNGLAAGVTLADAQLQALLEIIERDAISSWWEGEIRADAVPLSGAHSAAGRTNLPGTALALATRIEPDESLLPFLDWLEWLGVRVDLQCLPSTPGTLTLLAVGWLPGTDRWLYGAGTHLDSGIAVRRAVLELVQSTVAALATPSQVAPGRGIPAALHPKSRLADGAARQPSGTAQAGREEVRPVPIPAGPAAGEATDLAGAVTKLATELATQGRRTFTVDVTRPEVGVAVARVVVEGQRGMPLPMR